MWWSALWHTAIPIPSLALRAVAIYLALLLALRLFGKREVGQFTLFDLVLVLLAANAVQPAITGPDSSLLGGLVILAALFALNAVVARLATRLPALRRLTEGEPTIIARSGRWLASALAREGLTPDECLMALREHGVADVSEVALAVLETDGTISVVPSDTGMRRGRRRVRTRRI
jgi:uncharacterized membrane protein YcaP (DUF421 family)